MGFALNIAALILVLGITWVGMIWLSGRIHGVGQPEDSRDPVTGLPRPDGGRDQLGRDVECDTCSGIGALSDAGKVSPCPACNGTGVAEPR